MSNLLPYRLIGVALLTCRVGHLAIVLRMMNGRQNTKQYVSPPILTMRAAFGDIIERPAIQA
jgi:hypothetical protein